MSDEEPKPLQPTPLAYATEGTDRTADLRSADRMLASRLAFTLGYGFIAFMGILLVLICILSGGYRRGAEKAIGILSLVYLLPAIALAASAGSIQNGSVAGVIVALVAALLAILGQVLVIVGSAALAVFARDSSEFIAQIAIAFLFIVANSKLVYHLIRVLMYRGSCGRDAQDVRGVEDVLDTLPVAAFARVAAVVMLLLGALGLSSGIYWWHQTVTTQPPAVVETPPPPPAPPAPVWPDYKWSETTDHLALVELPAAQREVLLNFLTDRIGLTSQHRALMDVVLQDFGKNLVSAPPFPRDPEKLSRRIFRDESNGRLERTDYGESAVLRFADGLVNFKHPQGGDVSVNLYNSHRSDYTLRDGIWEHTYDRASGGKMTLGTIKSFMGRLTAAIGRPLTERQGVALLTELRYHTVVRSEQLDRTGPVPLFPVVNPVLDPDRTVALDLNGSRMVISPEGKVAYHVVPPQQITAPNLVEPTPFAAPATRLLDISPYPMAALTLASAVEIILGFSLIRLVQASGGEIDGPSARRYARYRTVFTFLAIPLVLWCLIAFIIHRSGFWATHRWTDVSVVFGLLFGCAIYLVVGIWFPWRVVRRAELAKPDALASE